MYNKTISATILCFLLAWTLGAIRAEETTPKPAAEQKNTTAVPVTTVKPKIDIIGSALCKKCACDKQNQLLDCSGKQLKTWFSAEEWSSLQNGDVIFETIKLLHNNLTEIPKLPDYPVKKLYLSFNQIASIAKGAFQNLTALTKLDLSYNKLDSKALVPDVFRGKYSPSDYQPMENLRELDLGFNELHTLDADLFEHLPKLEELVLCKNTFHVIDDQTATAISGLRYLKTLDLSYMQLKDLHDNFLHGPRDLEVLILAGNLLKKLPDNIELAVNLQQLMLDENQIADFSGKNIFPEMRNLRYLSISYMPDLTKLDKDSLSNLPNLTTLVASNNPKLSSIDARAFAKNTTNSEIFDYPPIEQLYLHNNNLSVLEHDLLMRWDKVTVIDLRYNPWTCECTNKWLIHTLMPQINGTKPLLANDVICYTPVAWQNVTLLDLDLKHKALVCDNGSHPEGDSFILIGFFVGILLGIPLTIASLVIYRRGCFGLLHRGNNGGDRALYNRASFTDDFHI